MSLPRNSFLPSPVCPSASCSQEPKDAKPEMSGLLHLLLMSRIWIRPQCAALEALAKEGVPNKCEAARKSILLAPKWVPMNGFCFLRSYAHRMAGARRPEGPKARRPEGPKARRPEGPKARRPEGPKARRLLRSGLPLLQVAQLAAKVLHLPRPKGTSFAPQSIRQTKPESCNQRVAAKLSDLLWLSSTLRPEKKKKGAKTREKTWGTPGLPLQSPQRPMIHSSGLPLLSLAAAVSDPATTSRFLSSRGPSD